MTFDRFSTEDGLGSYTVTALARDGVGFLWIGTQRGVSRYDGVRLRTVRVTGTALADDYVRSLAPDPRVDGAVWIGTSAGGLSRFDPTTERFTTYRAASPDRPAGLTSDAVRCLSVDSSGVVWAGTLGGGLVRFDPRTGAVDAHRRDPSDPTAIPSDSVRAVLARGDTVWVGTPSGLARLDVATGRFRVVLPGATVSALAAVGAETWAGTTAGLVRIDASGAVVPVLLRRSAEGVEISAIMPSRVSPNRVWVGTRGEGLLAVDRRTGAQVAYAHDEDDASTLPGNEVLSLLEDRDGILWAGTFTGLGKALLDADRFPPPPGLRLPDAVATLPVMSVHASRADSGVVWLGTVRQGLVRVDVRTGAVERFFQDPSHPFSVVFAIHEDRHGWLWLGGPNRALARMNPANGTLQRIALDGPPETWIARLYAAPSTPGVVWVATRGAGLLRAEPPTVPDGPVRVDPVELESRHVWDVREDPIAPGRLWVTTHGSGVRRLDVRRDYRPVAARVDAFARATSCLPTDRVVTALPRRDGTVWLGTFDAGLVRFDPARQTCRTYTPADGLAGVDAGAVLPDARGRLWVPTSNGLSLFDPDRNAFTTFTPQDGLRNRHFFYLANDATPGGVLWLGGTDGVNAFDASAVKVRSDPPPVVLTDLRVDETPMPLDRTTAGLAPVDLGYERNDLTLRFAALDLRRPERNRYRVRLQDDAEWTALGERAEARFFGLAPGAYTIQVAASNGDGYWNDTGVRLPVRIRPPFWRAWWFWTLMGAFAVGLAGAAHQYRLRQLLRVERTRQRIADDLHDDIGSKISAVALRLDVVGRLPDLPDAQRTVLTDLSGAASAVVDDLRDAVWIVDAGHDSLSALAARMEQFADAVLPGRYAFARPDALPDVPLDMERRRHLYLFFKEAVHNAARHSGADHVRIRLAVDDGRLALTVADDGCGFAPDAVVGGGRGLSTLHTRADALGGTVDVDSAPGEGTTIRLVVALPR